MSWWSGEPERDYQVSNLSPSQERLKRQQLRALNSKGAGGAFGTAADYYRDLLSDDSATFEAMQAPEQRRFNEQIIPDLSEQFAGMGAGGLSSSGFRNAAVGAGTDLSERLGAIRAQLRSQGAAGLAGMAQHGLTPHMENIHNPQQAGFGQTIAAPAAEAVVSAASNYFAPGSGAVTGPAARNIVNASAVPEGAGSSDPYGNYQKAPLPNRKF